MSVELSVVVPTLNEAGVLPILLDQLARQEGIALEVIVVDGGSMDSTRAVAERAAVRLIAAPRGRGAQMNAGAALARGEALLFLHADSELVATTQLRDSLAALREAMARGGAPVAAHFRLRFARRSLGHRLFYRYLEEKTALNRPGTVNGDQGLLLTREYFRQLGGFDERLPFLEDQRIAAKIFETGRWLILPGRLLTSARRFEAEGAYRRYTLMSLIMGMHAAGADEFFERAPKVYAVQVETGRLRIGAYLALARRVLADAGWRRGWSILFRAGRFTRQNSWQLFFFWDVLLRRWLGEGRSPFLRFHDAVVRPLTSNAVADALAALLIGVWFLGVLPAAYGLIDRARGARPGRAVL
jgi:rSAM/selenodomain-associated transferase 2